MGAKQFDRLNGIQSSVVHPMMRLAHERQIIGMVVACIVVKVGDGQTSLHL
jgi:hypothetical protein